MALEPVPRKDWYSVLGADPCADVSDLKQKYQKLILMYHPDKQSTTTPAGTLEERLQKFIEVDQAWKVLGNEATRREYDLQRHGDRSFSLSCRCGGRYLVSEQEAAAVSLVPCDTCSLMVELLRDS